MRCRELTVASPLPGTLRGVNHNTYKQKTFPNRVFKGKNPREKEKIQFTVYWKLANVDGTTHSTSNHMNKT